MHLSDFDLFIFDFDGTLSTSTALVRVLRLFKRRYSMSYVLTHRDKFNRNMLSAIQLDRNEKYGVYDLFYELYAFFFKPRIKPGALELLEKLKKEGKKIALFSDGKSDRIRKELAMLRIENYFDIVLSADTIRIYKPNPTPLLLIIKNMHSSKRKSIYIGDMGTDILTAKFAGIGSCAIADGFGSIETLKEAKPDFIFKNLSEFKRKI